MGPGPAFAWPRRAQIAGSRLVQSTAVIAGARPDAAALQDKCTALPQLPQLPQLPAARDGLL